MKRSLTAAAVDRIKPPAIGQADHHDQGYPGLALRVSYGGAKAWVHFYRHGGKLHRATLGRYPAMSLGEAREAWRNARQLVAKGENPLHARPKSADSFSSVAAEWLKRDQAGNRTVKRTEQILNHDVLPIWGDRPISGVSRRDCIELLDAVADRGAETMARRLHAQLHRLFRWAVGRGIIPINPMTDLPKNGTDVKRDRVLTREELGKVWSAARDLGYPFGAAAKRLVLTAARKSEISALRWPEVQGDEIKLTGDRTKNGEAHIIPLSFASKQILASLPRIGREYAFTLSGVKPVIGWAKAKTALDKRARIAPWRLHDLRRTVATGMQRLGINLQTIEAVLGHTSGSRAGIVGVYQRHSFDSEKRAALEAWAKEIERIVRRGMNSVS